MARTTHAAQGARRIQNQSETCLLCSQAMRKQRTLKENSEFVEPGICIALTFQKLTRTLVSGSQDMKRQQKLRVHLCFGVQASNTCREPRRQPMLTHEERQTTIDLGNLHDH